MPSPIDEEIKTSVVRDTLRLVMTGGQQQQQQKTQQNNQQRCGPYAVGADGAATRFLPVVTAATEARYAPLMILDRSARGRKWGRA